MCVTDRPLPLQSGSAARKEVAQLDKPQLAYTRVPCRSGLCPVESNSASISPSPGRAMSDLDFRTHNSQ